MYSRSKWLVVVGFIVALTMILAACKPETIVETREVIVKETVIVPGEVPDVEPPPDAGGECCDVYRIALFEDPITLNFWNYLGPGHSARDLSPALCLPFQGWLSCLVFRRIPPTKS